MSKREFILALSLPSTQVLILGYWILDLASWILDLGTRHVVV